MDTKWKNRKKAISFILFFLGISLALGSMADILRGKPAGVHFWQADQLLEDDYQESSQFRSYIASRLENFLIMATGGDGLAASGAIITAPITAAITMEAIITATTMMTAASTTDTATAAF